MKKIILLTALFFVVTGFSQNNRTFDLYVAFDLSVQFSDTENILTTAVQAVPELQPLQSQYQFDMVPGVTFPKEKFTYLEQQALKISGDNTAARQLRNLMRLSFTQIDDSALKTLAGKLEALDGIAYVSLMSLIPEEMPWDIPPTTPDYEPSQNYLGPDPGVNMLYAWSLGLTGENIRTRDVEYGMNVDHEDLNDMNTYIQPGMTVYSGLGPDWTEHGTATAGVVTAHRGGYGVSGMAHGIDEFVLFPEYTEEMGYNRAYAVQESINNSQTGDVIIYEMQTGGQNGNYVPAEYNHVIWNLTKAATDAGIIIVAAAGNGNENLDDPFYETYMNRGDSGAIIVGAGSPDTAHNKLWFSTYGSRVDLQGWGLNVLTSGYGDYAQIGGDFNQNYTMFSGTSSATPIVSSCVIVLLSHYHSLTGEYLTGVELRNLLKATGIPQGSGGNIGELPDMEAALENLIGMAENKMKEFSVFPNPATDFITVYGNTINSEATVEIFNTIGQKVYSGVFRNGDSIDISSLQSGLYVVKFTDNSDSISKKIVKK